ncbi:MAG: MaoC family dehydratase N-terminal domain-containing protein [Solirubrobacterales bacterium]|nr:MaoC family dehydratase N-terminal domain-containing protein [Solirubrobacterales bacterium]
MPVATDAVGKTYPPVVYAVGREKIREYAAAIAEADPVCSDLEAARAAGHPDVVAPPMFAVVYGSTAIAQPFSDPEVGIDFAHMVHGGQEFAWGPLVVAGDEISTETEVNSIDERGGMGFYVFETRSTNQRGERVSTGTWTMIVRGKE